MAERPVTRTHRCGELRAANAGQAVQLAGWVHSRREHGGVAFLDVRDAAGVVQVVANVDEAGAALGSVHELRDEFCVRVDGTVRLRPEGTENPTLPTGAVEVLAAEIRILAPAATLPFPIDGRQETSEERRIEHRYLDLRRPEAAALLRFRAQANGAIRRALEAQGFLEVETPTMTRSTPEGARDYLVPSRLKPGAAYALPQSPQLYKQMLMVAGVERYYQIARCWRDEDLRADRQPEFTQLDLEGAFWWEEDVRAAVEAAIGAILTDVQGREEPAPPFPVMTWDEAMARYGSDKPDVRFGMEIVDLSDVFAATAFEAFTATLEAGGVIRGLNATGAGAAIARSGLDRLVELAQEFGAKGLVWVVVEDDGTLRAPVAKFWSDAEHAALRDALGGQPGDLLLLVADPDWRTVATVLGRLRLHLGQPAGHDELAFLWIVDFPMFEPDGEGGLTPAHHPFTHPQDVRQLLTDPAAAKAHAYDLVLNGYELGSGSVRIFDPALQQQVFDVLGIDEPEAERRFGFFLEALRYGTPPHAGFAVGLDRLYALLSGTANIRDVIAFPKLASGQDPLTRAPTEVDAAQWRELGLRPLA